MTEAYAGAVPCGRCDVALRVDLAGSARCACGAAVRVLRFRPFRRHPASPSSASAESDTPCAYHAGNLAVASCARCGSFLCSLCCTTLGRDTYCTSCFETLRASGGLAALKNRYYRPHAVALGLALVSLLLPFLGVFLVPVVLWQAVRALRDLEALSERESGVVFYVITAGLLALGSVAFTAALVVNR